MMKLKAVAAPSQNKYKGRWGVLKRAKSVFIEFITGDESICLDVVMAFEPDHAEPFLRSLAEKHSLSVKEELEEGTYVTLRNDAVARECVKLFGKQFLPGFAGTEHEECLSCKRYYCGDLAKAELHNNKHKYPWDDSAELYSQTNVLNDGRIVKAIAWSEYGQSYVDFEISAEDLPEMAIDQLLAYLAEQDYDAFSTADKSKLSLRLKNSYQPSISKTAPPDRTDYVITWAQ